MNPARSASAPSTAAAATGPRRLAIIGAGPIGVEAALLAVTRGWRVAVYDAGQVGEHLLRYGDTVLFTPFGMTSTPLGRDRLRASGHEVPPEGALLRARDLVSSYLAPMASLPELRDGIRERARVTHVGRDGFTKTGSSRAGADATREGSEFLLRIEAPGGETRFERADVVIDASGIYGQPNGTGPGALPALGEDRVGDAIDRHLPPTLSDLRERVAGRRVLLVGDGHSAATALRMFDELSRDRDAAPERVEWIRRDRGRAEPFVEVEGDPLPARRELAAEANRIARSSPWITTHRGATVLSYERSGSGSLRVTVSGAGDARTLEVDRVLALVGYRPDLSITRELQIHHCYASEGPMKLAAAILSAGIASSAHAGDCLSQVSHGPESLRNPEPGFFVLGAKSYGRNASFLLSLGHRQIEDVLTLLGDPAREPVTA
ncbi:MAG TPA: hypothetical protein VFP58_08040 [Candidatus Eisenbacteria bacterium]|nr:hypothetical protein [Candidatus Eisenbacteria bacterium]